LVFGEIKMVKLAILGLLIVAFIGLGTLGLFATGFSTSYLNDDFGPGAGRGGCYRNNAAAQADGNSGFACGNSSDFECDSSNNEDCEEYCEGNQDAYEDCPRENTGCPNGGGCS
jgi:hypothetical protein